MKWVALALAVAPSVLGHCKQQRPCPSPRWLLIYMMTVTMQYLWVNGVDQGQNTYLRVPPSNNPVTDVTSTDIRCNVNGLTGSATGTKANVPAGANITLEWHQHAQRTGEDAISVDRSVRVDALLWHAAVQVYIAKAPSTAASFDGSGTVWTKIYSSGLISASSQTWATDVVRHLSIVVCVPGRPHRANNPSGQLKWWKALVYSAQEHSEWRLSHSRRNHSACAQISVVNGGSASPPKIALPGAYKGSDPGITVNIYNGLTSYTAPGGTVWSG
ncbi:glycoside hydrolase family 61 protein [Rhizoctonia solani AG-1 IA]|uniref:AA9 family lytic polysaccharide monooxygenase n=1 Tax=Thanatephorus cucumeris (strain AG1-IA) TaxID=983506 RepID=L8X6A7_THACA|nr:glycoside hydrolase family 61 protein [Rhizoctonia solani AG-1 IA]